MLQFDFYLSSPLTSEKQVRRLEDLLRKLKYSEHLGQNNSQENASAIITAQLSMPSSPPATPCLASDLRR
jgi:hypothetical protein